MIPIFPWGSLLSAVALLYTLFANLFPSVANYTAGVGMGIQANINNTNRLIRNAVVYGLPTLIMWFGLLGLSVYMQRWEFAAAGFVSTGLCLLVLSILFLTARGVATPMLAHVKATAASWSAMIPLQAMPFHQMPLITRFAWVAGSPIFGLYLLFALPVKGMLELIKAAAAFGPTLDKWLRLIQRICAAACIVVWVLCTVTMFQLQWGLHILDLVSVGLGFLFVGMLIALLLMKGQAFINVWEFIQAFGFCGLFLIGLMWFHHELPQLAITLQANLQAHYNHMLGNVAAHDFMAVFVILGVFALISYMPWCRSFAGPLAMTMLFFYTFSTDVATPFYTKWEWWVGFVGLFIGLLFMRKMHTPPSVTPHVAPGTTSATPGASVATGAATVTPAPAAHAGHGGGHGGSIPWKTIGAVAAVFAGLALLVWIGLRVGPQSVQASTASLTSLVVTSAPAVNTANLEDFRVLKDGSADGEWEFQLDARKPWQTLPISVSDGDEVEFSASGTVCGNSVGCVTPNGQTGPANRSFTRPEEFPYGDAWFQALVGRIGSDKFQVGVHKTYVVPDGMGSQSIELMDNYRMPEITTASGGFRVKIVIRKK